MDVSDPPVPAVASRERTLALLRERIVAFAASRIARESAEDLAQDVMLLLHEKYPHVESLEELVPLCLRILRFKMAAAYRKAARHGVEVPAEETPLADGNPDPETRAGRRELAERLEKAVRKLPSRCRELLRLKLEGRSFPEIQKTFGAKSINTIYTWDFRCRKHLLELMGGTWEKQS
jgi:RNA polymerase sigma-70 factor (ECF subfamily)